MKEINFTAFDDKDKPDADIIKDCVHCGFCLSACPTYLETGNELDSPRGRIYLIKSAAEGKIPMGDSLIRHLDRCLGCLACEPACPSGVRYGSLIEAGRSQIERRHRRPFFERLHRFLIFSLFQYPERLKLIMPVFNLYQKIGLRRLIHSTGILRIVSDKLAQMEGMLPSIDSLRLSSDLPRLIEARGKKRHRVALITGCVQSVLFSRTNEATARVLSENGCEVVVPKEQGCCGALSVHSGRLSEGRGFAKSMIKAFEGLDVEAIIVNSAGCGSTIKEYERLLKDDLLFAKRAKHISDKTKDVMEFLADVGLNDEMGELNLRVTYQDACHLGHAQRIKDEPRRLLSQIPGLELIEMNESDVCCGSAGIYNLVQPEMSQGLLERKLSNVKEVDVDYLVAGNPGCLLQLRKGLKDHGLNVKVAHPVELLDWSYRGAVE